MATDASTPRSETRSSSRSWAQQYHLNQRALIDGLDLTEHQQLFHENRWHDEVDWIERAAVRNLRMHQALRVVAIVGGAAISGLVAYGVGGQGSDPLRLITLILSLAVTASIALDEFFRFGDRWRHERLVVESMRSEGALFIALAGPYMGLTHALAFPRFAAVIERIAQDDVKKWVTSAVTGAGTPSATTSDAPGSGATGGETRETT
jgi:hypothetical protein